MLFLTEIRKNVQINLKYYLKIKKISQKELSKKLNVSQSAVTNWIKGSNSPDIEMVAKICDILDISVNQLFGTEKTNEYTINEKLLILHYRNRPEMQLAVNKLLDIDTPYHK